MSKYTIALNEIDVAELFDFSFTLWGSDASEEALHKSDFIDRFYKYYYFKEISADSVYAFNRRLESVMNEWLPRFNKLYEEQATLVNGRALNSKLRHRVTDNDGTIDDEFDTITNEHENRYLDTPQTPLNSSATDEYATSINKDKQDVNTTNNRTIDTTQDETITEEDKPLVDSLDDIYKKYHDLDMDFIRKFNNCFLKIY